MPDPAARPCRRRLALGLPRTVVVLGLVSLANDTASEMVTPLLPLFLTAALGAGPAVVGLVEGLAEATASVLKLAAGWLADRGWSTRGLVLGGYGLSNTARPLIGLALGWGWVLALRFADRIGKGLRTAPRDALIAAVTEPRLRGRAFGFHRALDHAGAMLGPLLAFALLTSGVPLGHVFLISVLPGLAVMALLAGFLEAPPAVRPPPPPRLRWGALDRRLRALVLAVAGLALGTAPEVFLVLWATGHGMAVAWVPLVWAAAHAVKALVATPAGMLSDRLGRLPVVLAGWSARVLLLVAIGWSGDGALAVWGLFLGYAAVLAFTEGAERALAGDLAPGHLKGTVYGLYHVASGLAALPGGVLFGAVWQAAGMRAAFATAAALTAVSAAALVAISARRAPG